MATHQTGTREEWLRARFNFSRVEKELTRRSGEVTPITFRHQSLRLVLEEYRNAKNGWALLHKQMRPQRKRRVPAEAPTN
jgi:hypothetical protein